jgi:Na+-transporting NADH:ubiquinone oxidoreductase subunit E
MGLGLTVVVILGCTVPINYLLEKYVLVEGALSWLGDRFANTD